MRLGSPITVSIISEVENLLPPDEDFEEPVTGIELGPVDKEVRLGLLRVLPPTGVVESDSPKILELPYRPQIGHVKNEYQNIPVVVAALPEPVTAAARVTTLIGSRISILDTVTNHTLCSRAHVGHSPAT